MNAAQEVLVVENQRLVYFVANRFRHRAVAAGIEFDDLVATGMLGLCKAARVYDPSRAKFSVLAVRCIENEMRLLLRQARRRPKTTSLDDVPREDDESKAGHPESVWLRYEADFSEVEWREFAGRLSARERSVLALAWLGYTQKDIAKRVGISLTHVSRVLARVERRWNHQSQAKGG
ncbi:sigma-70 family RNA polymerase sigma factor [Alicyclobacillus acidocaldarius]|uniref:RNA polymerase sigma factor SigS n=1 Tax=Alicyclobacillus acidocaldarius subsp. acidocaldarius (strain ATCC 27009 / DSM 446 / BCRC 14685 / JCM 5260 / KCTC 1825 / NBRC 15652 / NCIMB 11725 / NRRL B-14509 / 104-IA) TaxID=521098 RepID=C8WVJ6_ALIAD|nr:sigma-70 family RNA polymerase sigma factor [Alicyclobacillus acidocaldarius]ACV58118.1 RNA polymerase, sigma 28 subunit, FliA/WhiG subfamily [Alicyclobacillus acidocaldarius subsp. acidocaldarius DSM 446]